MKSSYYRLLAQWLVIAISIGSFIGALHFPKSVAIGISGMAYLALLAAELPHLKKRKSRTGLRFRVARILLVASAAVYVSHEDPDVFRIGSLGVLIMLIWGEGYLPNVLKSKVPRAANLEGVTFSTTFRKFSLGLWWFGYLAPLLALLTSGPIGSAWMIYIFTSSYTVFSIAVIAYGINRRKIDQSAYGKIPQLIEQYSPKFIVYWDAPARSQFQLRMWMDSISKIGDPFVIVVRNGVSFKDAVEVSNGNPVIHARTMADLDRIVVPSISVAFYVNNAARNTHMVRYSHITHVQLLHGESDKAPSYNPVTAMYDKVLVAGQAAIDRYANNGVYIPQSKFEIIGRPQVDGIVEGSPVREGSEVSVLYAPTWRGYHADASYSSLHKGDVIVSELLKRGCRIVFRPHPYSYSDSEHRDLIGRIHQILKSDAEASGRNHLYGNIAESEMSIVDCFNSSDAMVADVSSVVADYLHSKKPFSIFAGNNTVDAFVEGFPLAKAAYLLGEANESIRINIAAMLGDDPLNEIRVELHSYYFGNFPGMTYTERFGEVARTLIRNP